MTYTDDQNKALDSMSKWVKTPAETPEDLCYTLDGAAGTGKTTIIKAFIASLSVSKKQVAVTAPTHQAKKVISNATDFPASTIQKLLGLRPDVSLEDFNPNNPKFNPIAQDQMGYYKYVIIDESSMLNAAAVKLLKERAAKYNVRVIFLGDAYQLPPINETMSKVFTSVKNISTLNEVVRQDIGNPMTPILKMLRTDVKYGTENAITEMLRLGSSTRGDEGFRCLEKDQFGDSLLNMYNSTEYLHDADHIRFLAYTNQSVEAWCNALRSRIVINPDNQIAHNEMLIGYSTIVDKKTNDVILENGESYEVINIQKDESPAGIPGYYVKMATIEGRTTTVFIIDKNNKELFVKMYLEKLTKAKASRAWQAYYNFKNYHLTMEDITIPGERPCRKDIYYAYGSTIHKSQGATYTNMALNLKNVYIQRDLAVLNRLLYVGLSRATSMNLVLR